MSDENLREQALRQVLQDHPELAGRTDAEALAQVAELVEAVQERLALQREVEELQRKEFAEAARKAGDEARRRRSEEERLARQRKRDEMAELRFLEQENRREEERKQAREKSEREAKVAAERQAALAAMSPLKRWITTHKAISVITAVLLVISLVAGIGTPLVLARTERAAAQAALAVEQAALEASEQADRDKLAAETEAKASREQLLSSCSPEQVEQHVDDIEVMNTWTQCADAKVRAAVGREASEGVLSTPNLTSLVKDSDPAVRMALAGRTDLPAPVQDLLAKDSAQVVRVTLARNTTLTQKAMTELIGSARVPVLQALMFNPRFPLEKLPQLLKASDYALPIARELSRIRCQYDVPAGAPSLVKTMWRGPSTDRWSMEGSPLRLKKYFEGGCPAQFWYSNGSADSPAFWIRVGNKLFVYLIQEFPKTTETENRMIFTIRGNRLVNPQVKGTRFLAKTLTRVKWCDYCM